MVFLSFGASILLGYGQNAGHLLSDPTVVYRVLLIALVAFLCSHYFEQYDLAKLGRSKDTYKRIVSIVGILALLSSILALIFPEFLLGRHVFLLGFVFLAITLILWRWAYIQLISLPRFREHVFLIGSGERAIRIHEMISARAELGMDIVGWLREGDQKTLEVPGISLRELANIKTIKRIIVAMKDRRINMPVTALLDLKLRGIRIEDGTSLLERMSGRVEVEELQPSWMIFGEGFELRGVYPYVRKFISLLLASILTTLTLPLIPLIFVLIKLTSPGPALYKQKRLGTHRRVFDCYKFRTMHADAEADTGPMWASDDDPRITRIGRFLRRTRLDEIPQLWNVLRGDMAFVGPRPERPEFVEKLTAQIPYYNLRHAVRPGLTGWAQINYGYGSSVEESKEKLCYDLYYIRNVSPMLDLLIVFYTIRAVIIGRGVR